MSKISYYEILEVSPNASQAVIRAAYKSLIQNYHPDKNSGSPNMEQQTINIREAFEVLSDPQKRMQYDESLRQQKYNMSTELQKSRAAENNTTSVPAAQPLQLNNNQSSDVAGWAAGWFILGIFLIVFLLISLMSGSPLQNHESTQVELQQEAEEMRISTQLTKENEQAIERMNEDYKPARTILKLATNIKVKMPPSKDGYSFCDGYSICTHYITIPTLGVVVHESDSEKIIQHIQKNQNILIEGVKNKLSKLPYTDFTQVNGEAALKLIILEQMNQTIVGNPIFVSQYKGVEEVLLPDSFSLH